MGELRGAASDMSSPAGSMVHLQNLVLIGNIDLICTSLSNLQNIHNYLVGRIKAPDTY